MRFLLLLLIGCTPVATEKEQPPPCVGENVVILENDSLRDVIDSLRGELAEGNE